MSIAYFLTILFWPLDLFLENSFSAFLLYSLPATLTYLSIINPAFSLLIPIISPKLLLLPFFILIFFYLTNKINKAYFLIVLIIWAIIATARFNQFYGQSIFKSEYELQQEVVRNTQLYDSIFLARLMHNKARIRLDKFNDNLFALTDPNNYFFEFHPRQPETSNQLLNKFPFVALVPMLIGFLQIKKLKNCKIVLSILVASLLSLSVLKIYDRHDFVLYVPLALIGMHGLNIIFKYKNIYIEIFKFIFIAVSLIEFMRLILI